MGAHELLNYIFQNHAFGTIDDIKGMPVHDLYFDLCSIIVPTFNHYYCDEDKLPNEFLREIVRQIDYIVHVVSPKELIYLSYDGQIEVAKFDLLNKRLEKRIKQKSLTGEVHLTLIQLRTAEFVKEYIQSRIDVDPIWSRCKVVINFPLVPGESEHKISDHIRFSREQSMDPRRIAIFSNDGGMILFSLQMHEPDLVIIKKASNDFYTNNMILKESDLSTISLRVLRDCIAKDLGASTPEEKERLIDDVLGIMSLTQNYFFPVFPEIKKLNFDKLIECYKNRSVKEYLVEDGKYNRKVLKSLLEAIATFESNLTLDEKKEIELEKWNNKKDDEESLDELIKGILEGFDWILATYTTGIPSMVWTYPGSFAPPLCLVIDHVEDHVSHFEMGNPIKLMINMIYTRLYLYYFESDNESKSESDNESKSESDNESKSKSKSDNESKSESESESDNEQDQTKEDSENDTDLEMDPDYDLNQLFPRTEFVQRLPDGTYINEPIDFEEMIAALKCKDPPYNYVKTPVPFVVKKDELMPYDVHSSGPFKPVTRADAKKLVAEVAVMKGNPCEGFDIDFSYNYIRQWKSYRYMQRSVELPSNRLKLILNYFPIKHEGNVALWLSSFKRSLITPGYTTFINGDTLYSNDAILLIKETNQVYPKYIKEGMSVDDFEEEEDAEKVITYYTKTKKTIPLLAPSSTLSLPINIIHKIEDGVIKALARVRVIRPCMLPVGATGVVIANDPVNRIAYLLMDMDYGSTSTLHYLLKSPRGIIIEYDYIEKI